MAMEAVLSHLAFVQHFGVAFVPHVFLYGVDRCEVFASLVAPQTDEALSDLATNGHVVEDRVAT